MPSLTQWNTAASLHRTLLLTPALPCRPAESDKSAPCCAAYRVWARAVPREGIGRLDDYSGKLQRTHTRKGSQGQSIETSLRHWVFCGAMVPWAMFSGNLGPLSLAVNALDVEYRVKSSSVQTLPSAATHSWNVTVHARLGESQNLVYMSKSSLSSSTSHDRPALFVLKQIQKMNTELEALDELLSNILAYINLPFSWVETFIFWLLHLPTTTSFRMFPQPNAVPGYPAGVMCIYSPLLIVFMPAFKAWLERPGRDRQGVLGQVLGDLIQDAGPIVAYLVLFARIWLFSAGSNAAAAQFLTDGCIWTWATKFSCLFLIL